MPSPTPNRRSRRSAQGPYRLSALTVNSITKPGWHADGGGLYLEVDPSGRKHWAMRVTVDGKCCDFGLGPIHKVSLQQARDGAATYREKAYAGIWIGAIEETDRHDWYEPLRRQPRTRN